MPFDTPLSNWTMQIQKDRKQQEMIHRKFSDNKVKLTRTLPFSPVHRGFPVMRDFIFEQLDLFQLSCSPCKRMLPQLKGLSNIVTIDYIVVNLRLHPSLFVPLLQKPETLLPDAKTRSFPIYSSRRRFCWRQ